MLVLQPGDLQHLEQVGSGGFGLVYKGWSQKLGMEVALKMIQGAGCSHLKKLMKNLMKERDVMQKASNPHVLRLLGLYQNPDNLLQYGLVMEYMPYGSLRSLFDEIPDVPWPMRFQILHQVVLGMNYLHSLDPPIIHRDLKPSNVLLNKHFEVQITDFGLSKIIGVTTSAGPSIAGTWSYMPPEALKDINYEPTKAFDVYSFGILTWTIFSATEPYPGGDYSAICYGVCRGQRPKESTLDQYSEVRMVPEAKKLMIQCWDENPDSRPSFHDCSKSTMVMYQSYQEEVVGAVRSIQDRLENNLSEEASESADFSSGHTEEFLRNFGKEEEKPQPPILGGGDENKSMDLPETSAREESPPESETGIENFIKGITSSGDFKKITNQLSMDTQPLKKVQQFANATGKMFREEIQNNPAKIFPVLKSIFS
ncbi:receptor-interacting serine/threonine-protein kinase 3-like [Gastrophryne carolinensis]